MVRDWIGLDGFAGVVGGYTTGRDGMDLFSPRLRNTSAITGSTFIVIASAVSAVYGNSRNLRNGVYSPLVQEAHSPARLS